MPTKREFKGKIVVFYSPQEIIENIPVDVRLPQQAYESNYRFASSGMKKKSDSINDHAVLGSQ